MPGQLDKILTARSTQLLPTNSTPSHALHELTIHFLLVSIFSDKTDIHHIQLYYSKIYIYENSPASTEPAVVPSLAYFCPVTGLLLADVVVGVCPMPAVASAESAAVSGMAPSRLSSSWLIRSRMPCSWCRKYRDSSLVNCFGWLFTVFTITSVSYNTNATNDLHQCMKLPKVWIIINLVRLLVRLLPSVLWHCWLGGRKGIRPVKNRVVGYWLGYLSGTRCRLAYGPADATGTHFLLLQ